MATNFYSTTRGGQRAPEWLPGTNHMQPLSTVAVSSETQQLAARRSAKSRLALRQ